ncbi:hypothetical protein L2E82_28328 [Cichorium intybus]|uniref:Uncharacterized protein n=1 Tax=Cichorium intybus TaxID=13427 RepID=A0ACB9CVI0_CICIN|nr:hypothetical protein L2E82_28328 [Cichorium intybus]
MAGVDEAVVNFVNGEIKNSISTVIEPYAMDTDSKEKLIGSCNFDMVSSDSGTDCFSIPNSMNTKGGLIDNHIFENQTETVLGENQGGLNLDYSVSHSDLEQEMKLIKNQLQNPSATLFRGSSMLTDVGLIPPYVVGCSRQSEESCSCCS